MRPLPRLVISALAVAMTLSVPFAPARAAWQPGGTRLSPLPAAYHGYYLQSVSPDAAGGIFVTWLNQTYNPAINDVYDRIEVQHLDRNGDVVAGWPASGLLLVDDNPRGGASTLQTRLLGAPSDGAHGAFVVTHELRNLVEFPFLAMCANAYHVESDGTVAPLALPPNGLANAWRADVDADGLGGLVICSLGYVADSLGYRIMPPLVVNRFDGHGAALWPALVLAPAGQVSDNREPGIAGDGGGGAFVAWVDLRSGGNTNFLGDLYLQHVRADGALDPAWPASGLRITRPGSDPGPPRLISSGADGVWLAWTDHATGYSQIHVTHVSAAGSLAPGMPPGGRVVEEPEGGQLDDARADGAGGLYLLRSTAGDPGTKHEVLHHLASDGSPCAGWPQLGLPLDARPLGDYSSAGAIAVDDHHGAFVAYDLWVAGTKQVYLRHVAADGQPAVGWSASPQFLAAGGTFSEHTPITWTDGGAIVAWNDSRYATAYAGTTVYAQRVLTDGSVATTVSLVSADTGPDGVRIAWQVALEGASELAVERGDASGAWTELARPTPGSDGRVEVLDAAAAPGAHVGYRLAWTAGGRRFTSEPAWVEVPIAGALALAAGPNPARTGTEVRFTLPRAGRAELSVLDVSGRGVRTLASGALGAGTHVRSWDLRDDAGRTVGAGLYLLRLRGDAGTLLWKLVVAP